MSLNGMKSSLPPPPIDFHTVVNPRVPPSPPPPAFALLSYYTIPSYRQPLSQCFIGPLMLLLVVFSQSPSSFRIVRKREERWKSGGTESTDGGVDWLIAVVVETQRMGKGMGKNIGWLIPFHSLDGDCDNQMCLPLPSHPSNLLPPFRRQFDVVAAAVFPFASLWGGVVFICADFFTCPYPYKIIEESVPLFPAISTQIHFPFHQKNYSLLLLLSGTIPHLKSSINYQYPQISSNFSPVPFFMFHRLFPSSVGKPASPPLSPSQRDELAGTTTPKMPSAPLAPTKQLSNGGGGSGGGAVVSTHVDIDAMVEEYAWRRFKDLLSIKGSGLDSFKSLDFADVEFDINRKKLVLVHAQPQYNNIQLTGTRPNTIFKSLFTNNTSQTQTYSLKTERTSESICGVAREQGFMFGAEAELSLKIPGEIAELKTGFKHEVHFNKLTENIKSETLTWSVDNNIQVPAGGQTEAAIIIEEMSYHGTYAVVSSMSGSLTINIRRLRDGLLVLPVAANVATIIGEYLQRQDPRLKGVVSLEGKNVMLKSKGTCHFQFALKQYVELNELSGYQRRDITKEMAHLNMLPK